MDRFSFQVKWLDFRLRYHNLANDPLQNAILDSVAEKLWIPPLIFSNNNGRPTITYTRATTLMVIKNGTGKITGFHQHKEALSYRGFDNPLVLTGEHFMTFDCDLDHKYYPFDYQKCFVEVSP